MYTRIKSILYPPLVNTFSFTCIFNLRAATLHDVFSRGIDKAGLLHTRFIYIKYSKYKQT